MLAEILLKVAADPNVITGLNHNEIEILLMEPQPPAWAFQEAACRKHEKRLMALLFSHPKASALVLEEALDKNTQLLDRYHFHVSVVTGEIGMSAVLKTIVPEPIEQTVLSSKLETLLALHLPPLSLGYLKLGDADAVEVQQSRLVALSEHNFQTGKPALKNLPRVYKPLSRFVMLGDFLYYLTFQQSVDLVGLPIAAKVALALNHNQELEPFLNDADARVRRAAQERQSWNAS